MGIRDFRCLLVCIVLAMVLSSASPLMADYDRTTQQVQQRHGTARPGAGPYGDALLSAAQTSCGGCVKPRLCWDS